MPFSILFKEIGVILAGYILGCFATGYYLVRWRTGQDLHRSGATGGRNAGRALGWQGAVFTALFDLLKGSLAIWIGLSLNINVWGMALTVIAVVAGHLWPAQLNFRGGKGLSTAYGAVLVYDFWLAIVILGFTVLIAALSRQVSLSVMIAVALAPIVTIFLGRSLPEIISVVVVVTLILYSHRNNLPKYLHPQTESLRSDTEL
jgi:acyl phosphate:glycerol-3-phosphate acyltransferase